MKKFRHYVLLLVTAMAVFGCSKDNDDTESNQNIKVESVALADQSVIKGSTVKLEPAFTPATATNKNVTWTSSKPEVATITADGTVTGVAEGEATITVATEDGGLTANCKISVIEKSSIIWAKGNLIADGNGGAKIGTATDGGLFFQFGSLIGWSSTGTATIAVKPADCPITTWNSSWISDPSIEEPTAGKGDPCKYYLKGTWRLPTIEEFAKLFPDEKGDKTYQNGWIWETSTLCAYHNVYDLKFPAAGARHYEDGQLIDVGSFGNYWSSSPSPTHDNIGCLLALNHMIASSTDRNLRALGLSIRCVRDNE